MTGIASIRSFANARKNIEHSLKLIRKKFIKLTGLDVQPVDYKSFPGVIKKVAGSLYDELDASKSVLVDWSKTGLIDEFALTSRGMFALDSDPRALRKDTRRNLFISGCSSLLSYLRYSEEQLEYEHYHISSKKQQELLDLDIGSFEDVTIGELLSLFPNEQKTALFFENKYVVLLEHGRGCMLHPPGTDLEKADIPFLKVSIFVATGSEDLMGNSADPYAVKDSNAAYQYASGVYYKLSSVINTVHKKGDKMRVIRTPYNKVFEYFTPEHDPNGSRLKYKTPAENALVDIVRAMLYINSKNVDVGKGSPIDPEAKAIISSGKSKKVISSKLSSLGPQVMLRDLDDAVVSQPPGKTGGPKTGRSVSMHIRQGHLHRVKYGPMSIKKEERPFHIYYYPRMVVGSVMPITVNVKNL